jgi:hypothetical protein
MQTTTAIHDSILEQIHGGGTAWGVIKASAKAGAVGGAVTGVLAGAALGGAAAGIGAVPSAIVGGCWCRHLRPHHDDGEGQVTAALSLDQLAAVHGGVPRPQGGQIDWRMVRAIAGGGGVIGATGGAGIGAAFGGVPGAAIGAVVGGGIYAVGAAVHAIGFERWVSPALDAHTKATR